MMAHPGKKSGANVWVFSLEPLPCYLPTLLPGEKPLYTFDRRLGYRANLVYVERQ
jgi:hypothetical protein